MATDGNHTGTLVKPHGFQGEMVFSAKPQILERLSTENPLFIEIDGQRVPFFIEEINGDPASGRCILKLEFIDSDIEARKYTGLEVYSRMAVQNVVEEGDYTSLVSYHLKDRFSGKEAKVIDYIPQDENPLLVLDFSGKEVLLPARADYIEEINHSAKTILALLPEGLIE